MIINILFISVWGSSLIRQDVYGSQILMYKDGTRYTERANYTVFFLDLSVENYLAIKLIAMFQICSLRSMQNLQYLIFLQL